MVGTLKKIRLARRTVFIQNFGANSDMKGVSNQGTNLPQLFVIPNNI